MVAFIKKMSGNSVLHNHDPLPCNSASSRSEIRIEIYLNNIIKKFNIHNGTLLCKVDYIIFKTLHIDKCYAAKRRREWKTSERVKQQDNTKSALIYSKQANIQYYNLVYETTVYRKRDMTPGSLQVLLRTLQDWCTGVSRGRLGQAQCLQVRAFKTVFLYSRSPVGNRCGMGGWLPGCVSELVNLHSLEQ